MTLLEAMSLGIPSVATRVGGSPEIIADGVTGILTEPDEPSSFSVAIEALCQNSALRTKAGSDAIKRFDERFSAPAMVSQYREAYGLH